MKYFVKNLVFLNSPVIFKDFRRVIEIEKFISHVLVFLFLDVSNGSSSLSFQFIIQFDKRSRIIHLRKVQKWPPVFRHFSRSLVRKFAQTYGALPFTENH
jgi:hypothetical protein